MCAFLHRRSDSGSSVVEVDCVGVHLRYSISKQYDHRDCGIDIVDRGCVH